MWQRARIINANSPKDRHYVNRWVWVKAKPPHEGLFGRPSYGTNLRKNNELQDVNAAFVELEPIFVHDDEIVIVDFDLFMEQAKNANPQSN